MTPLQQRMQHQFWNSNRIHRSFKCPSQLKEVSISFHFSLSFAFTISCAILERSREYKKIDTASWEPATPTIDMALLKECTSRGWDELTRRKALERTIVAPEGPAFYQQLSTALNEEAVEGVESAVVAEATLRCLKEKEVSLEELRKSDWRFLQKEWPQCQESHLTCSARNKFRSVDGTCNNLQHPRWGAALQPFRRLLPAEYEDGFSVPKPSFPTGIHPPGRQVSICMQNATNQYDEPKLSMLFVHFAHFIDHDLSSIAAYKGKFKHNLCNVSTYNKFIVFLRC